MNIKGFGYCADSLPETIDEVMQRYSDWLVANPHVTVTHFDTALAEACYLGRVDGVMDYYTYVLTVGYTGHLGNETTTTNGRRQEAGDDE